MILKPGKNPTEATSYRPISLLSVTGKIFERILNRRIYNYLENRNFFPVNQKGYRTGMETTDHLMQLSQAQCKVLERRGLVMAAIMFDAEKAFDKTWTEGLTLKMNELKIFPTRLLRLLNSFLNERTFRVRVGKNTFSTRRKMTAGTPQGAILSPLLYNIYTQDIPKKIANQFVKVPQYADDLCFYVDNLKRKQAKRRLQEALDKLVIWGREWRTKFNPNKTQLLVTTRKRNLPNFTLRLGDEILQIRKEVKYLGLTFQGNGKFTTHVEHIKKDMNNKSAYMRKLAIEGTIPKDTMLNLYKSLIRPKAEYAVPAWLGGMTRTNIESLEQSQRRMAKLALGFPNWTPTEWLYRRTGLQTLHERHKELGRRYLSKKRPQNILDTNRPHRETGIKFPSYPAYAILEGQPLPENN